MIYVCAGIRIKRAPEIVWGFLTDVSGITRWIHDVFEAERIHEPGVGMLVDFAMRLKGARVDATSEVTAWRPPSLLALETRFRSRLVLDRAELVATPDGDTELTVTSESLERGAIPMMLRRAPGLLGANNAAPPLQKNYEQALERLRLLVEAETRTPYR